MDGTQGAEKVQEAEQERVQAASPRHRRVGKVNIHQAGKEASCRTLIQNLKSLSYSRVAHLLVDLQVALILIFASLPGQ